MIKGDAKINGEVSISGSKNSALPIIAACILNAGTTTLYNVPNIKDTNGMFNILKDLGCIINKKGKKIVIDSSKINKFQIDEKLMSKMRSSVIIAGALLGRFRRAVFSYPGGCEIGARPIDLHINGFKKLGINIDESTGYIVCKCDKIVPSEIQLDFPSVGATENLILASVFSDGETIIRNVAMEPEIVDLQNFLNKMGAKVSGAGSNVIKVVGVKRLKEISYTIMPDRIEAGTFLVYTAMTGGKINLQNVNTEHILPVISKLEEAGCKIFKEKNEIVLNAPKRLKAIDIQTFPYPGFPTDMQSIFLSMLSVARGTSVVTENIFENRFKCVPELIKMGAHISISGSSAIIKGTKRLIGKDVTATDLRGGAALIGAALKAKGVACINNCEFVERGYENLEYKLKKLDVDIIKQRGLRFETEEKKSSSE
jgi:UDP-N-acetylglucosamine 1-carboxyvinyltransferase